MDSSNAATIARIWVDATPLATFTEQKAEQMARETTPARDHGGARKPSTMELLAGTLQFHANLAVARERVRTATINDLIAGRIVGLGRPSESYAFEKVDASFWIGAAVDWAGGTASRDGRAVVEVRLAPPDVLRPFQPEVHETAGRPSKGDVISAAIAAYAKEDPALKRSRPERFRAYRSHITSQGYDPRKDPGFSDKTFEKYESEFRRRNK